LKLWQKMLIAAVIATALIISGTLVYTQFFSRRRLLVSTTTSLWESDLLKKVEAVFEAKYPIDLQFIAAGSGVAIEQGRNGDVDCVLVHAPSMEITFLQQGFGTSRKIIAYNFFTIVGPSNDPALVNGQNVTEALKRIAEYGKNQTGKVWISRADNSGTHTKEQSLWKLAGFNYTLISAEQWYANAPGGMGETLLKAEQFSAYTLSDIGTYLKFHEKDQRITLNSFMAEKYELLNVYSVMAVNRTRHKHVNSNDTITFIKFLISNEGQQLIEKFGEEDYGTSGRLFRAAVSYVTTNSTEQIAQWIRKYAFLGDPPTECPPEYRDTEYPELYT
jgi:tungstate transport system substrate-binding protein